MSPSDCLQAFLAWIFNTHLIPTESRYIPSFGSKLATAQLSDGAKDYSITFSRGVRCGKSDFTLPDVDDNIFAIINSVVWRETQKTLWIITWSGVVATWLRRRSTTSKICDIIHHNSFLWSLTLQGLELVAVSCISLRATHSKNQTAKSGIVRHRVCGLKILKISQFELHPALKAFLQQKRKVLSVFYPPSTAKFREKQIDLQTFFNRLLNSTVLRVIAWEEELLLWGRNLSQVS